MQDLHSITLNTRHFNNNNDRRLRNNNNKNQTLKCPRCESSNTKFCYYNNYNLSQPRHFCKNCRRYWTNGGVLRNVPVGGGCRKSNKHRSTSTKPNNNNNKPTKLSTSTTTTTTTFTQLGEFSNNNNEEVLFNNDVISGFMENDLTVRIEDLFENNNNPINGGQGLFDFSSTTISSVVDDQQGCCYWSQPMLTSSTIVQDHSHWSLNSGVVTNDLPLFLDNEISVSGDVQSRRYSLTCDI